MASSHRERLLPAQGLPQDRNSLRQAGKKLSRFRLPHSRYHMVDLMSLGPSHLELKFATLYNSARTLQGERLWRMQLGEAGRSRRWC